MTTKSVERVRKHKPREKAKLGNKPTKQILVEDLRIGDEIATLLGEGAYGPVAAKSKKVEQIDECPGQWRTHIHVNRQDCYDIRSTVRVVM